MLTLRQFLCVGAFAVFILVVLPCATVAKEDLQRQLAAVQSRLDQAALEAVSIDIVVREKAADEIVIGGVLPDRLGNMALLSSADRERFHAMQVVCRIRGYRATMVCNSALADSSGDVAYLGIVGITRNLEYAGFGTYGLIRLLRSPLRRTHRVSADLSDVRPLACDAALALSGCRPSETMVCAAIQSVLRENLPDGLSANEKEQVKISCAVSLYNLCADEEALLRIEAGLRSGEPVLRSWAVYSVLDIRAAIPDAITTRLAEMRASDEYEDIRAAASSVVNEVGEKDKRKDKR